jgi:protein phosphatase
MDDANRALVDLFFAHFERLLTSDEDPLTSLGQSVPIPRFALTDVEGLLAMTLDRLRSLPMVLRVQRPVYVIGDIHGNLQDLIRIFRACRLESSYVFLGDIVDRGQFSLECALLLFTFLCRHPDRFFLIRGNHECHEIASKYGFMNNVISLYPLSVFDEFINVFNYIPLAAIIDDTILCVHGGICPQLRLVSQIMELVRPIALKDQDPLVSGILWSDPTLSVAGFANSPRKIGVSFGRIAVQEFLRRNQLSYIIRGHQVVDGVQVIPDMCVSTVFSSSDYANRGNRAGVIRVTESGQMQAEVFEAIVTYCARSQVTFAPAERLPANMSPGSRQFVRVCGPNFPLSATWFAPGRWPPGIAVRKKMPNNRKLSALNFGAMLGRGRTHRLSDTVVHDRETVESTPLVLSELATFRRHGVSPSDDRLEDA